MRDTIKYILEDEPCTCSVSWPAFLTWTGAKKAENYCTCLAVGNTGLHVMSQHDDQPTNDYVSCAMSQDHQLVYLPETP
jgi:hypothetical protein